MTQFITDVATFFGMTSMIWMVVIGMEWRRIVKWVRS